MEARQRRELLTGDLDEFDRAAGTDVVGGGLAVQEGRVTPAVAGAADLAGVVLAGLTQLDLAMDQDPQGVGAEAGEQEQGAGWSDPDWGAEQELLRGLCGNRLQEGSVVATLACRLAEQDCRVRRRRVAAAAETLHALAECVLLEGFEQVVARAPAHRFGDAGLLRLRRDHDY